MLGFTVATAIVLIAVVLVLRKMNSLKDPQSYPVPARDEGEYTKMSRYQERVVGVSKRNDDGSSRQQIIKQLKVGDQLELVRERDNQYDANAIAVHSPGGQIGYVSAMRAEELAPQIDKNYRVECKVQDILDFDEDHYAGVTISIQRYKPVS